MRQGKTKTDLIYAEIRKLWFAGVEIRPKIVALKSGYSATSKISHALYRLEKQGKIRKIHHSWHDVEIVLVEERA